MELESGVKEKNYEWFTLAHFLHPVQLNHLVGDLKSYIQYREDILRRIVFAEQRVYADQQKEVQQKVKTAKEILEHPANEYVASLLQSVQEGLNFFR